MLSFPSSSEVQSLTSYLLVSFSETLEKKHSACMSWSARGTTTKCLRKEQEAFLSCSLGDWKTPFKVSEGQALVRAIFLVCRQLPSLCVSSGSRDEGEVSGFSSPLLLLFFFFDLLFHGVLSLTQCEGSPLSSTMATSYLLLFF